jgi:UDP-3-O-[3-hydroxymyristoyl] glucosamine N-acyltransferase
VTIGDGAQIAAASAVGGDVPPGGRWGGTPARPFTEWLRDERALRRLARRALSEKGEK